MPGNMKKSSILIMILIMAIRFAMAQQGENLVENGTFEQGNVGFKSDFRFDSHLIRTDTCSSLYDDGQYLVIEHFPHSYVKNEYADLHNWTYRVQCVDPEGPSSGFFLAVGVNCAMFPSKGKQRLWYDSITIKPNTTYIFSCIVANIWYKPNRTNVGAIKLCVNEKKVSRVLNLPYSNEWKTLSGKFTSGPDQTGIEISIQDWNMCRSWGDKVAVDNIVFKEIQPAEFVKKEEPVVVISPPVKKEEPVAVIIPPVKKEEESVVVKEEPVIIKEEPVVVKEEPVIIPKETTPLPVKKEEVVVIPPKKIIVSPPPVKKVIVEKKRTPLPEEKKPVLIVKEKTKKGKKKKETPPVKKEELVEVPPFAAKSEVFNKSMTVRVGQKLELNHIQFERSKSILLPEAIPQLNDLVTFMKNNPTVRIRLEGHTDTHGDPERNKELSENRVKEVKKYLVENGIADNRIELIGYGGTKPLNSDRVEALSKLNRRVEVVIISE
jgi:outer membrane protein OmpA-like peptidoglycan-associated protein